MGEQNKRSESSEVRKTVTILFADVIGSTDLGERLDPESLRQVMTRYYDAMRSALERHGGSVEKFIGDAVMAVFGVPMVHEDDALRRSEPRSTCVSRWRRSTWNWSGLGSVDRHPDGREHRGDRGR